LQALAVGGLRQLNDAEDGAGSELSEDSPADSIATSVPAPIAIADIARAQRGASLTPSPTIATVSPACLEFGNLECLVLG
jgi:hypothetical protein